MFKMKRGPGSQPVAWWGRPLTYRLVLVGALAATVSCGPPPIESVYALRAFEREEVTPTVIKRHLDDLEGTLALIRTILRETRYQPGDSWTQSLALSEATASDAEASILREHPSDERPTTLAIYKRHVADVLARTAPAVPAQAQAAQVQAQVAAYPSLLEALTQVDPTLNELAQSFEKTEELARKVRDARAAQVSAKSYKSSVITHSARRNAEQDLENFEERFGALAGSPVRNAAARQVVKDALAVTSVTLRLAREAAALASMLAFEIPRLASLPTRTYAAHAAAAADLLRDGPAQVKRIRDDLEVDVHALGQLTAALARLDASDIARTPGFAYREGLVDEVVGFTSELLHFKADAGGEIYFFNPFTLSGGRDYTGRQNELSYKVDPIVLASAQLSAGFDLSRLPQAGGLKLGYATNRVYHSGGTIENRSLAAELGATGVFSDAIDAALMYSGWQSSVRLAHFTSGRVSVLDSANGTVATSAPFAFTLREIGISREFANPGDPYLTSVIARLAYFDYSLPRIMYEFQDTTPDAESPTWVYSRESPVQRVRTQLFTSGGISQFKVPLLTSLDVLIGVNMSFGAGRQRFYFLDMEGNRQDRNPFTVAMSALGQLGMRWRILHLGRFRAELEAYYQAQYLNSSLGTTFHLDSSVPIGSHALFHGPQGRFSAAF